MRSALLLACTGRIALQRTFSRGLLWLVLDGCCGCMGGLPSMSAVKRRHGSQSVRERGIGLVTGLLAAWLAFTVSGSVLFVERFVLHQSGQIDAEWKSRVEMSQQMTQQWAAELEPADAAEAHSLRTQVQAWMLSPWGHGVSKPSASHSIPYFLLFFAAGGGALGCAPACPLTTAESLKDCRFHLLF